jgi:hypothetical protein
MLFVSIKESIFVETTEEMQPTLTTKSGEQSFHRDNHGRSPRRLFGLKQNGAFN